jgi:hypothetical protein
MRPKVVLSWSTGKDAAWALHELRRAGDVDVVALLSRKRRSDKPYYVTSEASRGWLAEQR